MGTDPSTTGQPDPAAGQNTHDHPEPLAPGASNAPAEGEGTGDEHAGSEAARWRRKLRDTEAERDRLAERLNSMQRTEIERQAGELMSAPADLWAIGTDMSSLIGEDGAVDPGRVAETVQGILAERPHWAKHRPSSPVVGKPKERLTGGGNPDDLPAPPSWAKVIGKR